MYTAADFDEIYDLGHVAGTHAYRTNVQASRASRTSIIPISQDAIDQAALDAAARYRAAQQAQTPDFTDDAIAFDRIYAAGWVVATIAEQDWYQEDPDAYLIELGLVVESD